MSDGNFAAAVPAPSRVGQGTAVEQARAATEVLALVHTAHQYPRNRRASTDRMLEACSEPELAKKAFYAFPRGDDTISGLTIDAAAELAQAWGNIDYGLTEMRRDDAFGQSEMLAYCWDMETNVRHASTFIVEHVRETKRGNYKVTSARDIYEINANMGNRRMRAAILKVLPRWYKLQAEAALKVTLANMVKADGKPLERRVEDAVAWFAKEFAITRDQLEHKRRRPSARWSDEDLIQLRILGDSLMRKDLALEEAFPASTVSDEELEADAKAAAAAQRAPERSETSAESTPGAEQVDEDAAASALYADMLPPAPVEHLDHPAGEWMDGCPGCIAESVEADQEAGDADA